MSDERNQNQTLGRGEVHFAKFKPGTLTPEGYRYFGDTGEFNLAVASEQLPYYSMERGAKRKTKSVTTQTDQSGTFTCTDINLDNLGVFFLGESATVAQAAIGSVEETIEGVQLGYSYQLGVTDDTPIGARAVTITTAMVDATALVAGTDYELDSERGLITFLTGAENVTEGDDVALDFALAATSYDRMVSGNQQIEGALRFDAYNAEGDNIDYRMLHVRISPNGDLPLKGEDWMSMPFNVEILAPAGREAIYANGQPYTPA